jgi:hypothetical protein
LIFELESEVFVRLHPVWVAFYGQQLILQPAELCDVAHKMRRQLNDLGPQSQMAYFRIAKVALAI